MSMSGDKTKHQLTGEREALRAQVMQNQRLESMGTLAGGVAHEINKPINGIMNYAQLTVDKSPEENAITARSYEKEGRRWIRTTVEDQGAGIAVLTVPRLHERRWALTPSLSCERMGDR